MSFYEVNLAIFAVVDVLLLVNQRQRAAGNDGKGSTDDPPENQQLLNPPVESKVASKRLQLEYFLVYVFAVAADWLQGPHIYAMYKYEKALPEKTVAALYATGFISGAVSAFIAGELADRLGRRLACLVYCLAYITCCLLMLSDNLVLLFVGRIFGGLATTLLYTAFEAWLVTEYHRRELEKDPRLKLGDVFGTTTTLSSFVAIASGVLGDVLTTRLEGGRIWPFMAAAISAAIAAILILTLWSENYGDRPRETETQDEENDPSRPAARTDVRSSIRRIASDKRIWGLGLTSTFFEGTMYLFVFFWSAALTSARRHGAGSAEPGDDLPFGLIFSSFMCAMMAGATLFSLVTAWIPRRTRDSAIWVLLAVVLLVSCCLSAVVLVGNKNEKALFWLLCAVELCIGAYFPSMSFLKSQVVEDGVRGRVYSILRLPLNVFVVVAHALDREGDEHRNQVFLTCAALLMASFFIAKRCFS